MFGISTFRLVAYGIIIAAFVGLFLVSHHYYNAYIESQQEVAVRTKERDDAMQVAKECSDRTNELKKQSDDKSDIVKKAQDQAAIVAQGNRKLADKILSMEAGDPNRCNAASKLIQDYKAGKLGAAK